MCIVLDAAVLCQLAGSADRARRWRATSQFGGSEFAGSRYAAGRHGHAAGHHSDAASRNSSDTASSADYTRIDDAQRNYSNYAAQRHHSGCDAGSKFAATSGQYDNTQ